MTKRFSSDKGPSQRQLRAGELIRHALVDVLAREDLRDPALDGVTVTVSEVRPSPDLRSATVYCAPLGGGDSQAVAEGLNRCARFLRGRLGPHIALKFTPELRFLPDVSFDAAQKMDALLDDPRVRADVLGNGRGED